MRNFSHTIAEYACAKRCGYHRSVIGANWSLIDLIAVILATIPLWLFSIHEDYPWYCLISVFASECLLVYAAGFFMSIVTGPFRGTLRCKQCGASMMLCGRHFDPKGSPRPHWTDIVILTIFIGVNIAVWISIATGNF
jgi:hypothetical protein